MDVNEKMILRKLFQLKVLLSDGNTFEQLFSFVMKYTYPDFLQIKPQGQYGDRKCDGYSAQERLFFQVYAPEDIEGNEQKALDKLEEDFKGLLKYWQARGFVIEKFRYVINDKYKGVYASLVTHANLMNTQYSNIDIAIWTSGQMDELFNQLPDEYKIELTNYIPIPSNIRFDNVALADVVDHLSHVSISPRIGKIPLHINTTEKIQFNNLSSEIGAFLFDSLQYCGHIDDFFDSSNYEQRELLREKFNGLYMEGHNVIPDAEEHPDELFVYIYKKACPNNLTIISEIAVRALMAYYFEACDIFKSPEQHDTTI